MKYSITFLFLLIIVLHAKAQTIDASQIELNFHGDSDPQNFVPFQNGFFFTAQYGAENNWGRELWYSDGTPEGFFIVKDIYPGSSTSNPNNLTNVNNILYFTADDGVHGAELWKSDGTENGTVMVKDIHLFDNNDYNGPRNLIALNGMLLFSADDGNNGYELWKSDGTEAGTVMVKDISPNGNSYPNNLFVFNNSVFFIADDGVNGYELWKSDGTESGTTLVKNINPNFSALSNSQFLILNGYFYFYADNGTTGFELWKSDGTEAGTTLVKDINLGSNPSAFSLKGIVLNNHIIFEANDWVNGTELWKSDGTESGTTMIKNINNTNYSSIPTNSQYIKFDNKVYFLADDNVHGIEIWKTDGTANGTTLLKDIHEGSSSVWIDKFHVDTINNKLLFFSSSTNSTDKTLWVSNGLSIGTFELSTIRDNNLSTLKENFITINNSTILTGEDDINGNELWITDGTIAGTSLLVDLNYSNGSNPTKFTNVNGNVFFRANSKETGGQLFKSDGSVNGTQLVKDIYPEYICIDDLSEMKVINGVLYFSAIDDTHGYELWRSDGTENGTYMVKDIRIGAQSSMLNYNDKQEFTVLNDILYFNANDGIHGFELWRSDGTENGTFMIKDIYNSPINASSSAREFVLLNNTVYFIANDNAGTGLWTTDGTASGTTKIISVNSMFFLKSINNKLVFNSGSSSTSYSLWVSDGTSSGTSILQSLGNDLGPALWVTSILNDELYYVARNPTNFKQALYKTDGTISGTTLLFDGGEHPHIPNLDIEELITCGNYAYFRIGNFFSNVNEFWRTNGTITEEIITDGSSDSSFFQSIICYNNNLLYLRGSLQKKIWLINDNLTQPVGLNINVVNGPNFENNDYIFELGASDNHLYFGASTNRSGGELYSTNIDTSVLGINDYESLENKDFSIVKIYPNPANEFINIKSLNNATIEKVEIYDLLGKTIDKQLSKDLKTQVTIDVNDLNTGIYIIRVQLSDGNIDNLKLIVN